MHQQPRTTAHPDVRDMAALSDAYVFLRQLAQLGRRDAIFCRSAAPPTCMASRCSQTVTPTAIAASTWNCCAIWASCSASAWVGPSSWSRTAAWRRSGQFASGIAHEIRNPLATISLALEHLRGLDDLPDSAKRRTGCRRGSPGWRDCSPTSCFTPNRCPGNAHRRTSPTWSPRPSRPRRRSRNRSRSTSAPCPPVSVDRDRLRQVLINLLHNAQQASPPGAVKVHCRPVGGVWAEVVIANGGEANTGKDAATRVRAVFHLEVRRHRLGLPIVQRIVSARRQNRTKPDARTGQRRFCACRWRPMVPRKRIRRQKP